MQTIGERLEEARKRKGISIREAAEATKIRGDYLHKFESNQFDIKLPEIYVRGFLRTYGNFLKLPGDKLVNDYLALGLGEGGRVPSRTLGREIYGKMEVSRAEPAGKASAAATAGAGDTEHGPAAGATSGGGQTRVPFQPRMPLGGIDRAMLARNGLWLGIAALMLVSLLVWGVVKLASGSSDQGVAATGISPLNDESVYLLALAPVQVTAVKATADSRELAPARSLAAGDRYPLPNIGMLVSVSAREAVQFEFRGQRFGAAGVGIKGPGTLAFVKLP